MIEHARLARSRANSKNGLSLKLSNFQFVVEAEIEKAADEGRYSCKFNIPESLLLDKAIHTLCPELREYGNSLVGRGYSVEYLSASYPKEIKIDWRQS